MPRTKGSKQMDANRLDTTAIDPIIGIDCLVYGTPDMAMAKRIYENWGLRLRAETDARLDFSCGNGGEMIVHHEDAPGLPPRFKDGSNFREVLWGVSSAEALRKIGAELARDREVREDAEGTLHSVDAAGVNIGFRVSRCRNEKPEEEPIYNTVGNYRRIDRRATIHEHARPWRMGHVGFRVDDTLALERFYVERLGFWLSDRYAEGGASFLRCSRVNDHHNLFLSASPTGDTMFHHVAFEVRDIHEVFGGGLAFSKAGWETQVGPGRHPVSSAYFWYFKNPLGGAIEYFSDTDIATDAWQPVDFSEPKFSEWHLVDGIKAPQGPAMRSSIDNARERNRKLAGGRT
jgi:catechol 2,3-dioxygenase-like lactoylglutathione lyase family enzyme